jgi:polysaccharide pyruvyl transferase WcaK-like protein
VRDEFSAAKLAKADVANVAVVPDSAIEIAKWFGHETPTQFDVPRDLSQALDGRIVSIHVNDRYAPKDPAVLAKAIDQIGSQLDATPVLIAIGPCHGDDEYSRKVGTLMSSPHVVFDTPRAVEDIAHVISRSVAYVGSSMHGFITAASYGVPPLVVASHANQHKFRGLLSHVNGQDRLMENWASAVARTTAPLEPVKVADARQRVEQHWRQLKMSASSAVQHRRENLLLQSSLNLSSVFNARRLRARS